MIPLLQNWLNKPEQSDLHTSVSYRYFENDALFLSVQCQKKTEPQKFFLIEIPTALPGAYSKTMFKHTRKLI